MYSVPADGADRRFLGGSARARNGRVARRAGAEWRTPGEISALDTTPTLLVPADSALMLPLFSDPVFLDAIGAAEPSWLEAAPGAEVLVGPAGAVVALVASPAQSASVRRRTVPRTTILALGTRRDRRRSTRAALEATGKATDGWVSRHLNRPISRACSAVALSCGMNATAASVGTLLLGLFTAAVAAEPGYWPLVITGLLFHLASVLDGVDGEIARATLTESPQGARLDTRVDQATYVSCLAGVTVGWVREGAGLAALYSAVAIGVALLGTLAWAGRFVARHAPDGSFVWIDRAVRRAARETGRLPLRLAASLFTLLRRDLFALVFLGVSLTGMRVLIPVLILAGILVAVSTFVAYGDALAAAARAERDTVGAPLPA